VSKMLVSNLWASKPSLESNLQRAADTWRHYCWIYFEVAGNFEAAGNFEVGYSVTGEDSGMKLDWW
jgi:hypothetical protein